MIEAVFESSELHHTSQQIGKYVFLDEVKRRLAVSVAFSATPLWYRLVSLPLSVSEISYRLVGIKNF